MTRRKHRLVLALAAYLSVGSFVTQFGGCFSIAANTGVASFGENLIDPLGRFLGVFNVCGVPDVILVDANGGNAELFNEEDDMFFGCPTTLQVRPGGGDGGG